MTYQTLLEKEGIESNFLVILRPARQIISLVSYSGNIYYKDFDYGHVSGVTVNGISLDEKSSIAALTSDGFYFDYENERVYIYTLSPTGFVTVIYELYFGTKSAHWYRIPTNSTSRIVYFDSLVIKTPEYKASISNSFFGFLESQGTSISIGNPDAEFERHLYDSSFGNKQILVYHSLEDLETGNFKLVLNSVMKDLRYDRKTVNITILDKMDIFSQEFRGSFFDSVTFANINPSAIGTPIRMVYGKAYACPLTNVDYNEQNTTSNNRIWIAREGSTNIVTRTATGTPTTIKTYLTSVDGLNTGDAVKFNKALVEYKIITNVDRTSKYIEHTALTAAAVASDTVERPTCNVYIDQGGVVYQALYDRDYTEGNVSGCVKITLTASAESNLGISTITATENLYADIYGKTNNITEIWTNANSTQYSSLTNPIVILYDLFSNYIGITNIDETTFDSLSTTFASLDVGFSLGEGSFPIYKDIITKILTTCLLKFFLDTNMNWSLSQVAVLGTADYSIEEDEIIKDTINYNFDYNDIFSEIIVTYAPRISTQNIPKSISVSQKAQYLHNINKSQVFETWLLDETDAIDLADTLRDYFGDRKGILSFNIKKRLLNTYIGDTIQVGLEKLPGYEYEDGTIRTRKFDIIELGKGMNDVSLVLSDQKGLES